MERQGEGYLLPHGIECAQRFFEFRFLRDSLFLNDLHRRLCKLQGGALCLMN
jgi:hypothetical protein